MDGTETSDFLTVFILTTSVFVKAFCLFVFFVFGGDMKHLAVSLLATEAIHGLGNTQRNVSLSRKISAACLDIFFSLGW